MAAKKGVSTQLVLMIGILVLVAVVLLVGANLTAPLFETTAKYKTEDLALSVDSLLAAPEDAELNIILPESSDETIWTAYIETPMACVGSVEFDRNKAIVECGLKTLGGGILGFLSGKCAMELTQDETSITVSGGGFDGTIACQKFTKSNNTNIKTEFFAQLIDLHKEYDEINRKNKIK